MTYLLDTNILLEILLNQSRAGEVRTFLRNVDPADLSITEFSLYSIGIVLFRNKRQDELVRVVDDLLVNGGVVPVRLGASDYVELAAAAGKFRLDFDTPISTPPRRSSGSRL